MLVQQRHLGRLRWLEVEIVLARFDGWFLEERHPLVKIAASLVVST
jgi:hypothetical protein